MKETSWQKRFDERFADPFGDARPDETILAYSVDSNDAKAFITEVEAAAYERGRKDSKPWLVQRTYEAGWNAALATVEEKAADMRAPDGEGSWINGYYNGISDVSSLINSLKKQS